MEGRVLYKRVKTHLDAFTDAGENSESVFDTTSCDEMIWSMLRVAGMGSDYLVSTRLVCHLELLLFGRQ